MVFLAAVAMEQVCIGETVRSRVFCRCKVSLVGLCGLPSYGACGTTQGGNFFGLNDLSLSV